MHGSVGTVVILVEFHQPEIERLGARCFAPYSGRIDNALDLYDADIFSVLLSTYGCREAYGAGTRVVREIIVSGKGRTKCKASGINRNGEDAPVSKNRTWRVTEIVLAVKIALSFRGRRERASCQCQTQATVIGFLETIRILVSLVSPPVAVDDVCGDTGRSIAATDDHRDIYAFIRHIRDIQRIRNAELRLLRHVLDMPVGVVCIVDETQSYLVMVASLGIEVGADILSEHETIGYRTLRGIVGSSVDIVTLDLDICAVSLAVFVPALVGRMVAVLFSRSLIVLEEIKRLGILRMSTVIFIYGLSLGDVRPVLDVIGGRVTDFLAFMNERRGA